MGPLSTGALAFCHGASFLPRGAWDCDCKLAQQGMAWLDRCVHSCWLHPSGCIISKLGIGECRVPKGGLLPKQVANWQRALDPCRRLPSSLFHCRSPAMITASRKLLTN